VLQNSQSSRGRTLVELARTAGANLLEARVRALPRHDSELATVCRLEAGHLEARMIHSDIAALHVLRSPISKRRGRAQRNSLMIRWTELYGMLEKVCREVTVTGSFKRLHDPAGSGAYAAQTRSA